MYMEIIKNITTDEERAFYGIDGASFDKCRFEGPADGESALKESKNISVCDCDFVLRYPLWHVLNADVSNSRLYSTCRAALWYSEGINISSSELHGIKALRECKKINIKNCDIDSTEFGWFCNNVTIKDSAITGEYFMMHSEHIKLCNVKFKGKYSFQYCKDVEIHDSVLDTKDAFWETENVTVYDSDIKGEYLAWYAKNLRLVRCNISGTQPLCYSNNVIMEDCTMTGCDLSFEKTTAHATVKGHIDSVKNPLEGVIVADNIGEIIDEYSSPCEIRVRLL